MRKFLTFLSIAILTSCTTSKQVVNSLSMNEKTSDIYNYYDEDSKVSYQVFNDEANLYINLKTFDKMAIVKILKSGLSIYFDETGKKNETVAVEYPLHNKNFDFKQLRPQNGKNGSSNFDVNQLLQSVPNSAVLINNENRQSFNLELNSTNISVKLEAIETELDEGLTYKLKIPLRDITEKPITSLENFSIGIVTGEIKTPQAQSGGGRPAGVGGGRPSGGGGRPAGVGGGRPSGGGRPANAPKNVSNITKPINIWFYLGVE